MQRTLAVVLFGFLFLVVAGDAFAGIIKGTVYDFDSGEPIPFATVRVEGTGQSMAANEEGRYRLRLKPGSYQLKFSHIAHYSERFGVEITDSAIACDVRLRPSLIQLKGIRAYTRAYDPAQRIIIEAIARKNDILEKLHRYSFDAYTKLVVRDREKDTNNILIITETQLVSYWKRPDKYKEVITSRRQTSNMDANENLVTIGQLLNFNQNRLDMGRYSVVSPTAIDAMDYYNYYLLDTIFIDSQAVFRLEIEPKNDIEPLFYGTIDIADSSFVVVGVEVGFSKGFEAVFFKNSKYSQRYAEFEDEYWMPIEVRFTGDVDIPIPGIPALSIVYQAALHNYRFEMAHPGGIFNEYILEVAENADDVDSTAWEIAQKIPLTEEEIKGYNRIDSIANAPKPLLKRALVCIFRTIVPAAGNYDYFHFNRIEGAYLGLAFKKRNLFSNLDIHLKSGWAFKGEYWQNKYGFDYTLLEKRRLKFICEWHDEISRRTTIISDENANPTMWALTNKSDQFDYFLEKGYKIGFSTKLLSKTRLNITFNDYSQSSVTNSTEYSFFRESKKHRPNPAILDGKLRSIKSEFVWDSRPRIKSKGKEFIQSAIPSNYLKVGLEYADPDFIDNDFLFRKYYVSIFRRQRTFGLGVSSIFIYGGMSDRLLPPQKSYTVDFGWPGLVEKVCFETLGETNFIGNRVAAVYLDHDFGKWLFRKSRVPGVKDLPFSLSVYGGCFWIDFNRRLYGDEYYQGLATKKPYQEIGFALGRITPLSIKMYFTWQLSDYPTEKFTWQFGLDFF